MERGAMKIQFKRLVKCWLLKRLAAGMRHEHTLPDGTKFVRMSADFYEWVYSDGYKQYKKEKGI